jgi:hypothetical protein
VRVSLSPSRRWAAFIGLAAGLAAGNLVGWLLLHGGVASAGWMALVVAATAGGAAARAAWRAQSPGELAWDGSQWAWCGIPGEVGVAIDLDGWMLLQFQPAREAGAAEARWLAASRATAPQSWSGLRAALHSQRRSVGIDAIA